MTCSYTICTSNKGSLLSNFLYWTCQRSEIYHHHSIKQGIINTLTHRCHSIFKDEESKRTELQHPSRVSSSTDIRQGLWTEPTEGDKDHTASNQVQESASLYTSREQANRSEKFATKKEFKSISTHAGPSERVAHTRSTFVRSTPT